MIYIHVAINTFVPLNSFSKANERLTSVLGTNMLPVTMILKHLIMLFASQPPFR